MKRHPRIPSTKISAVISDVDGTLVTGDKILTTRALAAVAELHANNIAFTIISSRPPLGLRLLLDRLKITAPIGCFNGGVIATADFSVVTKHVLLSGVARRAIDLFDAHGIEVWVFAGSNWLARDSRGAYVGREKRTVGFLPTIVHDFETAFDITAKIVGVSEDFELLARCEHDVRATLGDQVSIARSQPYYLDITHPLANKGVALLELSNLLSIPPMEIAVIGDSSNDISMFERSGLSIAMGNASPEVRRAADFVTDSNCDEGFANAIERFVLGRDRSSTRFDIEEQKATHDGTELIATLGP